MTTSPAEILYYLEIGAAIATISMLITASKLFAPIRNQLPDWTPAHCPVCLSFWVAMPWAASFTQYCALVAFANAWMLIIAKLYLAIDDMNYEPDSP